MIRNAFISMRTIRTAVVILLCGVILFAAVSCASAETLGFGLVNDTDVALRKSPGGQKLIRLPKETCVWIRGSRMDDRGELWYDVSTVYNDEGTNRKRSGWMKAEFIDAGETLWHDVSTVKADNYGMMALRTEGTVECVCETDNPELRRWAAGLRDVRQIHLSWLGWSYYALDGNGTLSGTDGDVDQGVRLACDYGYPYFITKDNRLNTGSVTGFSWISTQEVGPEQLAHVTVMTNSQYRLLLLTDDGRVFAGYSAEDPVYFPETDWESWTEVDSINAGITSFTGGRPYSFAFAAVRKDGTVLAAPAELAEMIGSWQDMKQIEIGYNGILGLKRDGTAVTAGPEGVSLPDVSGWSGITQIANGGDYFVGLKEDGTLVFAGEHTFHD